MVLKKRLLKLPNNKTFFLFGARNTGKSTLIEHVFKSIAHLYIDLLDIHQERKYLQDPQILHAEVLALEDNIKFIVKNKNMYRINTSLRIR